MTTYAQRPSIDFGTHSGGLAALRRYIAARKEARARAEADHQFWLAAQVDPRLMAEIVRAQSEQARDPKGPAAR